MWALISANGIRNFPVLPGVVSAFVAVDHDAPGIAAATEVNARWSAAGREVLLGWSSAEGEDLNDLMTGGDHG